MNRTKRISPLFVFASMIFLFGCSAVNLPSQESYRFVPAADIPKVIKDLPSYAPFSISGLAFYHEKLFVSSNIGLVELHGSVVAGVHKWYGRDDVVSGPWLDKPNDTVWIQHNGVGKLFRLNGKDWQAENIPEPEKGYTRGDMLNGFRGASGTKAFYLFVGGQIWRWNPQNKAFEMTRLPEGVSADSGVALDDTMLLVTRTSPRGLGLGGSPRNSVLKIDGFVEIPNKLAEGFFSVDQVASIGASSFLLTDEGDVLRVTSKGIEMLQTPGVADTMTSTDAGRLLGSFPGLGIYEYDGAGWRKLYDSPYTVEREDHWAYMAASNGSIALAYHPKSKIRGKDPGSNGKTRLWLSSEKGLQEIPF